MLGLGFTHYNPDCIETNLQYSQSTSATQDLFEGPWTLILKPLSDVFVTEKPLFPLLIKVHSVHTCLLILGSFYYT